MAPELGAIAFFAQWPLAIHIPNRESKLHKELSIQNLHLNSSRKRQRNGTANECQMPDGYENVQMHF